MSNARAFALAGFKCAFTPLLSQFRLQWATPKSGCDRIAITLLQHFCICHAGPTLTTFFAKFVAQKQARAGRIIRLGFYFGMRAGRGRKGVNSTMLLMTKFFPISQMRQIGFGPHPQPFGDPRLRHRGLRPPPLRAGDLPGSFLRRVASEAAAHFRLVNSARTNRSAFAVADSRTSASAAWLSRH